MRWSYRSRPPRPTVGPANTHPGGLLMPYSATATAAGDDPGKPARLFKPADLLAAFVEDATAASEALTAGRPRGPITGLPLLDRELGGYLTPGIHVVHGGPGIGKSALAMQIAASCLCPALYVTCEMSPLELFRRLIARTTGTYLGRLKSGEIPPAQAEELARKAAAAAPELVIADASAQAISPAEIARALMVTRELHPHGLVVIDSLHSWAAAVATPEATEYDALNTALASLGELAQRDQVAVLVIAERNRERMAGGLHAGAGTRRIEYIADTVLQLDAPDDAPSATGERDVTAKLAKNRNGAPGSPIALRFRGALQAFTPA